MRRIWVVLLSGLAVVITAAGLYFAVGGTGLAEQAGRAAEVAVPAAASPSASASPSPTLGSTPQAGVNPAGAGDGDANDYNRVPLVVGSFLFLALLVGGSLLFYLRRRTRETREAGHHQG